MKEKSEFSRAFLEDGAHKTHVGGQALIEGIMMRGLYNWSIAVRKPNGEIHLESHDFKHKGDSKTWKQWPFVRGCFALIDSLVLGYKALEISAIKSSGEDLDAQAQTDEILAIPVTGELVEHDNAEKRAIPTNHIVEEFSWKRDFGSPAPVIEGLGAQQKLEVCSDCSDFKQKLNATATVTSFQQKESKDHKQPFKEPKFSSKKKSSSSNEPSHLEIVVSMMIGLFFGVVLFIVAPAVVTNMIVGEYDSKTLAWNLVDGGIRVAIFVFYIWLIGRMKDVKRMFGYHGAEHKTIHCFEHGLPLTPENAAKFPRLHVRCGTAFLIMVMIIAILVYTITPLNALIISWGISDGTPKLILVILARIILAPLIAGISYEITVKWAGMHPDNPFVRIVLAPGMYMQYLTTAEPDKGQLECAIAAMKLVVEKENKILSRGTL